MSTEARDALAVALAKAMRDALVMAAHSEEPDPDLSVVIAQQRLSSAVRFMAESLTEHLAASDLVLARREDAEDGAALRELREALPEGWVMTCRQTAAGAWGLTAFNANGYSWVDAIEPTIAAAARKAKEGLGGGL